MSFKIIQNNDRFKLLFNQLWQHKTLTKEVSVITNSNNFNQNISNISKQANSDLNPALLPDADININNNTQQQTQKINLNNAFVQQINLISSWDELVREVHSCKKCTLCNGRTNPVIERGSRNAPVMFVGEGPGENEDKQGLPFVGVSGQLLDKMVSAMKLDVRLDIYICNVVKCRPPYNRNPEKNEIINCNHYLLSQINLVKPKIIIALGRFAGQTLLNTHLSTNKLRGTVHYFNNITPVIVTYHPAYLLRNPSAKKSAWEDLQMAMHILAAS